MCLNMKCIFKIHQAGRTELQSGQCVWHPCLRQTCEILISFYECPAPEVSTNVLMTPSYNLQYIIWSSSIIASKQHCPQKDVIFYFADKIFRINLSGLLFSVVNNLSNLFVTGNRRRKRRSCSASCSCPSLRSEGQLQKWTKVFTTEQSS